VPYLAAVFLPPVVLLWCRKPWQALLNAAVVAGLLGWVPPELAPVLAAAAILWAAAAVAARRAPGRAARRIREAWTGPGHTGP
jgi:hypothetical protein